MARAVEHGLKLALALELRHDQPRVTLAAPVLPPFARDGLVAVGVHPPKHVDDDGLRGQGVLPLAVPDVVDCNTAQHSSGKATMATALARRRLAVRACWSA